MADMSADDRPLVVVAAGGTGGHLFPATALAEVLADRGWRAALVTDRRGGAVADRFPGAVYRVRAGGIAGHGWRGRMAGTLALASGCVQSLSVLRRLEPRVVVGFGGYASLPAVVAALVLGRRTIIHEQNAVLGRANRLVAGRVRAIATAFSETGGLGGSTRADVYRVGMPVRPAFAAVAAAAFAVPADGAPLRLLVLGGSQGAHVFASVVPAAIALLPAALRARLHISQQCRPEDLEVVRTSYASFGAAVDLSVFFHDVPRRMADAHLVIARAGASTVAELAAVGRPSILVPYPYAADNHQAANAAAVERAGAGWPMPQSTLSPEMLAMRLGQLFDRPQALAAAARAARGLGVPDAAQRLAGLVGDVCVMTPAVGAFRRRPVL